MLTSCDMQYVENSLIAFKTLQKVDKSASYPARIPFQVSSQNPPPSALLP